MHKLKPLTATQFISILNSLGYKFVRQKGSHRIFVNANGKLVNVPVHSGRKLDRSLMLKIIKKELQLSREEFEKLI